ncbi:(2Fe-2S)-binding protein [Amycolatopsis nivea]
MYACVCAAVTMPQVEAAVLAGARSVEEIGERCAAGTGCGTCHERLNRILLERAAPQDLAHSA